MSTISKKTSLGFTLIELLVVIALIATLAATFVNVLQGGKEKARDSVRMGDLKSLSKAVELYFTENGGQFPNNLDEPEMKAYFTDGVIPIDPKTDKIDRNYAYAYSNTDVPKHYCLGADLEIKDGNVGGDNGISCGGEMNLGSDIDYIIVGP